MTAGDDYLWDGTGDDAEVARLEALLGGLRHDAPMAPLPPRRRRRGPLLVAGAALAAAAIATVVLLDRRSSRSTVAGGCDRAGPGFAFAVTGDGTRCDGVAARGGRLPLGAWLETAAGSEASVRIADIGEVTLLGDSRLRAVATGDQQHRLELSRGRLRAQVTARPRLFVIDTPGVSAVDLGCAYELEVDDAGRTRLRVTSGVVSLEGHGRAAYVPAGVEVATVDGGPGTPVRVGASAPLRAAVARFDGGEAGALAELVDASGTCDTITLWNLLARTDGAARQAVFERLDALAIRPEWVLTDDVLAGRAEALESWRRDLEPQWTVGLSTVGADCFGPPAAPAPGKPAPVKVPAGASPPADPSPPDQVSPPDEPLPPDEGSPAPASPPAGQPPAPTTWQAPAPSTWTR